MSDKKQKTKVEQEWVQMLVLVGKKWVPMLVKVTK